MERAEITALAQKARSGDKVSLERLYSEFHEKIYFFIYRIITSEDTAEDLTSETFMTAIEHISELRSGESFVGWLYSIAYSKCTRYLKERSRSLPTQSDQELDSLLEASRLNEPIMLPDDYAVNEETKAQLGEIINSLSSDMRAAVIMYYYDDMSLEEIAEVTGDKVKTISARLCSAREKIKEAVLIYEKQHDDRLHALVPVPILTRILLKEAASIGVPDILPALLGANLFSASVSASANTLTNGVIAGGSKMTNFITAKVIAVIAAGVIAAGGITAAVLSKSSDSGKDTSSVSSSSGSSDKDSRSGGESKAESGGSDSTDNSDTDNGGETPAEQQPSNGSVYTYKDVIFRWLTLR